MLNLENKKEINSDYLTENKQRQHQLLAGCCIVVVAHSTPLVAERS
jgi:hypothetical protein